MPGVRGALARFVQRDVLRWAHRNVHYYDESLKSLEEAHEYGDPLATPDGARAFVGYLGDALAPRGFVELGAALRERAFPVPLQLLYARRDPMVPPSVGPRLHALVPGASFVWLEEASHFAHVDRPDAVLDAITPFLEAPEGSA